MTLIYLARRLDGTDHEDWARIRQCRVLGPTPDGDGWLLALDTPMTDTSGRTHEQVGVWPWNKRCPLADPIPLDSLIPVAVGVPVRLPAHPDIWFRGEIGSSPHAWRETSESDRITALEAWARREGRSDPGLGDREGAVVLLNIAETLRRSRFRGEMPTELEERMNRLPGWSWWDCDEIDLLIRYLREGGTTPIPGSMMFAARPVGAYASRLARIQKTERLLKTAGYSPSGGLSDSEAGRLEAMSGWPDAITEPSSLTALEGLRTVFTQGREAGQHDATDERVDDEK